MRNRVPASIRLGVAAGLMMLAWSGPVAAFIHVVKPGETLASIAERIYGRIQYEKLLVTANALEAQGGTRIVPGMRLEVPAVTHRQVRIGDTWSSLASRLLGSPDRADALAFANNSKPWLAPEEQAEIRVPYNLRLIVSSSNETITHIAYKFLGNKKKAWLLDRYNHLKGKSLHRGDVLLIPLTELPLTPAGRAEAKTASLARMSEAAGDARAAQNAVEAELPSLNADIRSGRYVDAISRGTTLLGRGPLTRSQKTTIHFRLLEAYVAVGAQGRAKAHCQAWKKTDPKMTLDPLRHSPKILAACGEPSK